MVFLKKIIKNALPYYFVKKYQATTWRDAFNSGGYYSPIPSMKEIMEHDFNAPLPQLLPEIDLNSDGQINLLDSFEVFYNELPFSDEKTEGFRYYFNNDAYRYADAIFLYCMLRHLKPKKIIEVGSGFSSCVTLDTNEKFMGNTINCTFIDPYPQRLESLLKTNDNVNILKKRLQEIPIEVFSELGENDILFIDSSHVSKFNSDVNYVIHEILPALSRGVYIHFHDIHYPFEYPRKWLLDGWAWNEQYILRAFLQYNKSFKIVLFTSYLKKMYEEKIKNRFPLLYKSNNDNVWYSEGGSIWLKKM